ncbi:hypothetical protein OQA88_9663 [Cercophora sp. LCS_1]
MWEFDERLQDEVGMIQSVDGVWGRCVQRAAMGMAVSAVGSPGRIGTGGLDQLERYWKGVMADVEVEDVVGWVIGLVEEIESEETASLQVDALPCRYCDGADDDEVFHEPMVVLEREGAKTANPIPGLEVLVDTSAAETRIVVLEMRSMFQDLRDASYAQAGRLGVREDRERDIMTGENPADDDMELD